MTERRVSVRLGIVGGKEVEATFEQLGTRGSAAMKRLGDSSEQAFDKVQVASRGGGGALQNVGYQVQDFAVQVGAGTSATQALSQQLPQLLSGFGLIGVLAGTAAAILIPLAKVLFDMGEKAVTAGDALNTLSGKIGELKAANAVYSTDGIQSLIDKYGEANRAVLLLIERQQSLLESQTFDAAKVAVAALGGEVQSVVDLLREYDSVQTMITRNNYGDVAAQQAQALQTVQGVLNEEFGLTLERARDLQVAFENFRAADTIPEMADAAALLTTLLQGSTLAGGELEEMLLAAEDVLRQLNAEGTGVNSWLDAAIGGAYDLASQFWDAARAAAAVRAAAPRSPSDEALQRQSYGEGQRAVRDRMIADNSLFGGNGNGLTAGEQNTINPPPRPGRTGGGGGATSDIQKEAERIFRETRTELEKYNAEIARLDELLKAGAISAETHSRAVAALGKEYKIAGDSGKFFETITKDLKSATIDAAMGMAGAFDRVKDAIKRAALEAVLFGEGPLSGLFGGVVGGGSLGSGLLGSVLGGIFGGARANGGPVQSGKAYLVGERGPELAMFGSAGTIIPNNRLTGGGGSRKMDVNINLAGANGDETIRQIVTQAVRQAIDIYDTHALPDRVNAISRDPRRRG